MSDSFGPSDVGRVLIEGQFCGFASLSIVNRELAAALVARGVDVRILPTDRHEGLDEIHKRGLGGKLVGEVQACDLHLRNAWPPVTEGMAGRKNGFVCWAWEESEIAPVTAARFNRDLDIILTTATYVSDALKRSGVVVPVPVVGNGVDHFKAIARTNGQGVRKRLLHISTCLPRKAPEALVEGFVKAFAGRDDVELYIKTSHNPHNRIRNLAYLAREGVEGGPHIEVDENDLTAEQLRALYASADGLVLASRGEGFGLPLAEAMVMGVPVIATRNGGQADFCREDTAYLSDSVPAKSTSHVAYIYNLWEDPSVDSLAKAMKALIDNPAQAKVKADKARQLMADHYTWDAVAGRVIDALKALPSEKATAAVEVKSPDYELVSTWNEQCGIATYSHQFYGADPLKDGLKRIWARRPVDAHSTFSGDDERVDRSWGYDGASMQQFVDRVSSQTSADRIWMQHHPGFFSSGDMHKIVPAMRKNRSQLLITLHNVGETLSSGGAEWLHGFDKVIAHSAEDVEDLGRAGIRAEVLPHGVAITGLPWEPRPESFTVGSFGFLTAHKNIELLVSAIALARQSDPRIRLILANSQRRERQSRVARSRVEALVKYHGLEEVVDQNYDFLSDSQVVERLAPCDLLAFPYGPSLEGASGAARMAIALDRPTLLSNSGVFKDLLGFSHVLRRLDVETLAEAILSLANDEHLLRLHDPARRLYATYHHWNVVTARAVNQIMSV